MMLRLNALTVEDIIIGREDNHHADDKAKG